MQPSLMDKRRRRTTSRAVLHTTMLLLGVAAGNLAGALASSSLPLLPPQMPLRGGSGDTCFVSVAPAPLGASVTPRPWRQYPVPRRRGGLATCFLGGGRRRTQEEAANEEDGTTPPPSKDGTASTSSPARRVFVATPHHHGNSHLEGLLDLAGREKEEFVAAVVDLEHHMQLEVAEALIFNIRKYTNGGMLPSADGSLPKLGPEQREVVTEYIPEVMRIMDRLEQQGHHHRDARVALYATEALSYDVSTKSVVKAAPQLARIFKNIDMMVAKHPDLKGGAPFIIQGMMFLNAPVPVRSVKKAKECFQSAHKIDSTSPRNNYFCGVTAYLEKDYAKAHAYFAEALRLAQEAPVPGASATNKEMPMDEYLHTQCRLGMGLASSRIK